MGNWERISLSGRGLGNALSDPSYDQLATFADKEAHTHLSPLFEQSVISEMRIIHLLPFFKKMNFLEHAKVRVGYTFLVAWEISRPTDSINYLAPPTFPVVSTNPTDWYMHSWNFGFIWEH